MSFSICEKGNVFDIYLDGRLFTSCNYSDNFIRPFMGPVFTSFGKSFTRFADFHEEHPHQRSVFVGIGDVNGVDFWNENGEGKGKMVFDSPVFAKDGDTAEIKVKLIWKGVDDGKSYLDEVRTFLFEKKEDCIAVNVSIDLTASYEDITVGKTKEAGPLGVRVADEIRADKNGSFTNSEGGVNEEFCWGKTAKWCNYSGTVDGRKIGIAFYDRKVNIDYPSAWHIRNYGLMAANNLFFKGGFDIKKGETVKYKFLLCFWEDNFDPAKYSD